jgi:hypothetical protein
MCGLLLALLLPQKRVCEPVLCAAALITRSTKFFQRKKKENRCGAAAGM